MKSSASVDFIATGQTSEVWRFEWHVDGARLHDINAALNFDESARQGRGFLSHLLAAWMKIPWARRPQFVVTESLAEDLVYLPSPCLLLARDESGSRWVCWYSTIACPSASELLSNATASRLFSTEGVPPSASEYLLKGLRRFRFREFAREEGLIFYRRSGY